MLSIIRRTNLATLPNLSNLINQSSVERNAQRTINTVCLLTLNFMCFTFYIYLRMTLMLIKLPFSIDPTSQRHHVYLRPGKVFVLQECELHLQDLNNEKLKDMSNYHG